MFPQKQDSYAALQAKIADLEQQLHQCRMELQQAQSNQDTAEPDLHEILEQVPSAIARVRIFHDYRIEYVYCSKGHEVIFGYTPEELITDSTLWLSRVISEDQETNIFQAEFERILIEQSFTVEYRFCCKDGSLRWVSSTFSVQRDDHADCWIATGVSTDITHHKQAEAALRQSEERFRQVVEHINEVFFVESAETSQVLYVSPAFERIWQIPCETLYHQPQAWFEAIHPDDREQVLLDLARRNQGKYVERQFRIVRPNGEVRWLFSRSSPVFDEAGHLVYHVGIGEDITERKQAEQKNQFQASLLDQVLNAVICTDLEGNITYWNRFAETLYQWSAAEAIGQPLIEIIVPPEQKSFVAARFEQLRQTHHSEGERLLKRKDGTLLTVLFATTVVRDEAGEVTGFIGVSMDITDRVCIEDERQRAEAALREREQQLAMLTANIPGGIYQAVYDTNGNLTQLYLNEAYGELLEYDFRELMRHPDRMLSLIHPEDRVRFREAVAVAMTTLRPRYLEYRLITASGKVKWIRDHARFSWNENGEFIVNGIDIDITDRKQIEAALAQSEVQYRLLFEKNPNPMWIFDTNTLAFLAVNDAAILKYGYSRTEFLAMTIADIRPTSDVPALKNSLLQKMSDFYIGEWRHRKQNGEVFDVEINSHAIIWENKAAQFIVAKDISKQKAALRERERAEIALQQLNQELEQRICERTRELEESQAILRERKQSFKTLVENTPDIVARFDRHLRHLYINPVIEQITGIPIQQWLGKTKQDLGLPENLAAEWSIHLQSVFDSGLPCEFEFDFPTSGGLQHYQTKLVPEFAPDGSITSVLTISRDITNFVQAQNALYQSEQLFRAVFENAGVGIAVVFPPDFKLVRTNLVLQRMLGYSAEELATLDYIEITHPDDRMLGAALKQHAGEQQSYSLEKRLICKNGQILWVIVSISLLWDANNQIRFGIGIVQNITSRKQAEEQVRQSETLLREAQQIARLGSWEFDVIRNKTIWSEEKFHIFGLDPDQPAPTYEQLLQHYIHPDDQGSLRLAVTRAIEQAEPYTLDLRIIQPDKTLGYVLVKGQPILNDQGQVAKLLGIIMDISDRKQAEAALQQQAQREQLLRLITHRVRQSLDLDEILETAVTEVRQTFQADRALIFRLLPEGGGQVIKEAVLPEYPTLGEGLWTDACLYPGSLKHYCVGQPRIVSDVAMDEWGSCLGQLLHQIGVRSKISAPIIQSLDGTTQIWGLLIVHACAHYRQWLPEEAGFLQQISNQLAIAIQQSNLYQRSQTELIERQQAENRLRASLQEKEVLLKEVHHRVKNNMQMISSLLNLQADSIQDPEVLQPFIESQRRVKTMALIHEKLYQSNNLAQINFADYVQELADELLQSFRTARSHIHMVVEVADVNLTVDTAIPCSLIISELVTNALKYAFPQRQTGEICIRFTLDPTHASAGNHRYILSVKDNGVGIPQHIHYADTESLGLQIVCILTQKLKGTINLNRTNGTEFNIVVPLVDKIHKT